MSKAGKKLIKAAREAVAIARGEIAPARIYIPATKRARRGAQLIRYDVVPPAAKAIVYAIRAFANPATEQQIIQQCARMRDEGMTNFNLGTNSNLRNRIQRNCSFFKIYRETWKAKGYADIFIRVKYPDQPVRWWVVDWYKP